MTVPAFALVLWLIVVRLRMVACTAVPLEQLYRLPIRWYVWSRSHHLTLLGDVAGDIVLRLCFAAGWGETVETCVPAGRS